uniref:DUF1764 domain-containing protein n=1 Tax=Araucaria cunninghamii TaxID=56994 RepID=A0A0D6R5H7_ARACU
MAKKRNRNAAADEQVPANQATTPKDKEQTQKETHNEIDEIFSKGKKSKMEKAKGSTPCGSTEGHIKNGKLDEQEVEPSSDAKEEKKKNKKKKKSEWSDPPPKPRRKTNDGYTIYSAEELGFNKKDAGGTPLCPFDCECCF